MKISKDFKTIFSIVVICLPMIYFCVESVRGCTGLAEDLNFASVVREIPGEKVLGSAVCRMCYRL